MEWTKNYRVKNGNVPFCYSVAWLRLPVARGDFDLGAIGFSYASLYVGTAEETQELVTAADEPILSLAISCAATWPCSLPSRVPR